MMSSESKFVQFEVDQDSSMDQLAVMISQDREYRCRDYFGRRSAAKSMHTQSPTSTQLELLDDTPDSICREKMVDWSYRVCDHFHTKREIVAYAFSFLDRFVDRCHCDRKAFKLAAMTALYLSTKIFNQQQMSLGSISELSRGEFATHHIAEMESIILQTLNWKMNPPIVQAFIRVLLPVLVQERSPRSIQNLCDRAIFFAELAVFDYSLITEDRYVLAIACILNAVESMDETLLQQSSPSQLLMNLQSQHCLDPDMEALGHCQGRLWILYGTSAQLKEGDILPLHIRKGLEVEYSGESKGHSAHSPIGVGHY
jgi:uncharacterized CHY-type Zn-finger protein